MKTIRVAAGMTLAAAMGCSVPAEDPSTSTEEETSSLAEAWRLDGKKDKHDKDKKHDDKKDCVEDAKFDLDFWGKKDKGMKSFWDFMKDEKDGHEKGKKLFLGRFDAKKHDFKHDGKKGEKRFFDLYEDAKDDFKDDSKKTKRVFSDLFDEAKDDFLDKKDIDFDKKDFDKKDPKKDFDFDKKDFDKKIFWGHSDKDGSDMMLFWGDEKDDGKDDDWDD